MARIVISDRANEDLVDIWCYIAEDSVRAADKMLATFDEKFKALAGNPGIGAAREELAPGIRSFPVKSYLIFYRPMEDGIEIARVLSGYMDIEAQF